MPGETFIEADRIDLQTVEEEDIPFLQKGRHHPSIRPYVIETPQNRAQTRERFERIESDDDGVCLLIVPSEGDYEGEPVGYVHIYPIYEDFSGGNLGVWILPKAQRRQYLQEAMVHLADYAFDQLGLRRLSVETVETNKPIISACKSAGFTHEGTYRSVEFMDGEWLDMHRYGILRPEYHEEREAGEA